MKNICFFCGDITRCGGTERISILLANEWAKQAGVKVVFCSLTESNSEPYFDLDSRVRRFRMFERNIPFKLILLPVIFKLFFFLRREKISFLIDVDVILSITSIFAAVPLGVKWISWEHFHFHENLGCRLRDYARKLAKRFASAIVVLTESDRLQYLETPSKARVVQIANAVPPPMKDACNETCREIPAAPFLLSVGRLDYQKGFERIPALAARVLKRHPGWKWIIVGDGIFRKRIQSEIESLGLKDSLLLAGRDNPFPYYRKASLLVMTSRYEGFGLVLLEALSEKCPVIAFNCRFGPSDIIAEGENGLLIPAEDFSALETGIHKLIEDEPLRARLASGAKESVRNFSLESFISCWNRLLEEI